MVRSCSTTNGLIQALQGGGTDQTFISDSAEKLEECFDWAQHERKFYNDFNCSSVRPEVLEG